MKQVWEVILKQISICSNFTHFHADTEQKNFNLVFSLDFSKCTYVFFTKDTLEQFENYVGLKQQNDLAVFLQKTTSMMSVVLQKIISRKNLFVFKLTLLLSYKGGNITFICEIQIEFGKKNILVGSKTRQSVIKYIVDSETVRV